MRCGQTANSQTVPDRGAVMGAHPTTTSELGGAEEGGSRSNRHLLNTTCVGALNIHSVT